LSIPQTILDIAEICAQHGLNQLILSPGSRNAPLTFAFHRHSAFTKYLISDERSAGYLALGIAQSSNLPAILVSTSGTAVLNYGPAIAEAHYQHVPLLVLTADRPPEWIDQNDGQAIRQKNVFENHTKKSFELPVDLTHPDAIWQVHRILNEAIITTRTGTPGPVHINVPFREPFYPATDQKWEYRRNIPVVNFRDAKKDLSQDDWHTLKSQWLNANKALIVGGQAVHSPELVAALSDFQSYCKVPVLGDITSNLHGMDHAVTHPEVILAKNESVLETLRPDLLITFGGGLVSKNLKLFLRKYSPKIHWHIQETGFPADPFQSVPDYIPIDPVTFFKKFKTFIPKAQHSPWYQKWMALENQACEIIQDFIDEEEFCELKAVDLVLKATTNFHLHLANSTPVRWVDLIGVAPETIEISANRGTSGIDGCSSTAVGHALTNDRQNLLITGDMAFFYDRNAFWHQYRVPNLKIILLNNHGGGIFRLIEGPSNQPELEELFVTKQTLSAANTAKDYGMKYLYCNSAVGLTENLSQLLDSKEAACLLEVDLPSSMSTIYKKLKASIRNSYE